MAWGTPPTFTVGQVATHTNLNVLSDDLTALAQHTHTGVDGDGADIFVPRAIVGRRVPIIKNMAVAAAVAAAWDSGNKWWYVPVTSTGVNVSVNFPDDKIDIAQLPDLSVLFAPNLLVNNVYTFGFSVSPGAVTISNDSIYFRLTNTGSAGTWELVTKTAAGGTVASSTGITGVTSARHFRLKVVSTSRVEAYIDEALVATNTTAIPATGVALTANFNADNNGSDARAWWPQYLGWSVVMRGA